MSTQEWLDHELDALDKYELAALLIDYSKASTVRGIENLAEFLDNWSRHSAE